MRRLPGWVWVFVAGKAVFHLATTRLEHHRDELYFISASKRLSFSYVDFQPVTPLLVRAERFVFGDSLVGLRLLPALAGAAAVLLAALIARELGGDRRAQTLAAFAALVSPLIVGMNSALNTVSLETASWMVVAFFIVRLLRTSDERWWVAIGLAVLVKFTMLAYAGAVGITVLVTPLRKHLRSKWLWVGGLLAAVLVAPSIAWQFAHGLPVVEFVSNQGTGGKILGLSGRAGYLISLVIFPGPIGLFVTIPGALWLWRNATYRALGLLHLVVLAAFFVASGKGYYASPAIAILLCAGAVAIVQRRQIVPRLLVAGLVINLLLPLPILVPLVPTSVLARSEDLAQSTELSERIGWRELAERIGEVTRDLTTDERERAIFLASNYTLPAAIEFYEDSYPVPRIAVSGHNSSYLWWPELPADHVAIAVGFERRELTRLYGHLERVGTVTNREGVHGYEWGSPIFIARDPKVTPSQLRAALKNFTA